MAADNRERPGTSSCSQNFFRYGQGASPTIVNTTFIQNHLFSDEFAWPAVSPFPFFQPLPPTSKDVRQIDGKSTKLKSYRPGVGITYSAGALSDLGTTATISFGDRSHGAPLSGRFVLGWAPGAVSLTRRPRIAVTILFVRARLSSPAGLHHRRTA
jgi:hypothetical protein